MSNGARLLASHNAVSVSVTEYAHQLKFAADYADLSAAELSREPAGTTMQN
jgi:hypothetical protein